MTALARPVRCLHLADLHFMPCRRRGECGPRVRACHVCIKTAILDGLGKHIINPRTRPDLILLAGDLTELRDGDEGLSAAAAPLDKFVRLAREHGIVVAGVTGEHDGYDGTAKLRQRLGWDWLLRNGDIN